MSQIYLAREAVETLTAARGAVPEPAPAVDPAQVAQVAINALVKYIPTEVVTLYLGCVSALPAIKSDLPEITAERLYWAFVIFTPLFFLLVFYNQLAVANQSFPSFLQWPWWRMFASTVAFCTWALAIPNNPFISSNAAGVLSGIAATFVSTLLTLVGPIVERAPKPKAT